MGYNVVAFVLMDYAHGFEESPHATAFHLAHPPLSKAEKDWHRKQVNAVAKEHDEPPLHTQALEVLPMFHSSQTKFFVAGGNCITELKSVGITNVLGHGRCVILELPEYLHNRTQFS